MDFKCNHCDKCFKSYQSRWNHINIKHKLSSSSKSSNSSSNILECRYCNKKLSRIDNLKRHENNCKSKNEILNQTTNNNINNQTNNIQNANTINNGIIDNKKIVINNFGQNNYDFLTDGFKKKMCKELIFEEDHENIIPSLVKKINLNPDHKENNNFEISCLRSKVGKKFINGKWKTCEKENIFKDLIKENCELIEKFLLLYEQVPRCIQDGFENFQLITENKELMSNIKKKIEMVSYIYKKNLEEEKEMEI
ncbi:MAG: hypothetical protein FGM30_05525 [Candidatus Fonsibacter sp.]|nr:hypothetical protein [Candidatus Fonsibacter sp.]